MNGYFVDVDGVRTHVIQEGSGSEPVLLLHGGGIDSALLSWKLTIPVLAENFTVYAPDFPGYGASSTSPHRMVMQDLVNFCLHLMDALQLSRVHLVGLSMGGGTALGAALANPDQVKSLTIVDSYGLASKVPMHLLSYWMVKTPVVTDWTYAWVKRSRSAIRWSLKSILKRPGSITPELVEEVFQDIQTSGGWKAFEILQRDEIFPNGLKTVFMNRLAELKMPVLIIHGDKDSLVPLSAAREAARRISTSQIFILKGCGHWPGRDAPEEFNRVLLEFLISQTKE